MHRRGKTHDAQRRMLWPVPKFAEMFTSSNFLRILHRCGPHVEGYVMHLGGTRFFKHVILIVVKNNFIRESEVIFLLLTLQDKLKVDLCDYAFMEAFITEILSQ